MIPSDVLIAVKVGKPSRRMVGNPLGDLYKTQIRQLARDMGIPSVIIEKPPSADLWLYAATATGGAI
jgi:hypothetical protein